MLRRGAREDKVGCEIGPERPPLNAPSLREPTALDADRLRHLIEVCRSVVAELEPEVLLRRVVEVATELTGARYAALGVLNERGDGLERFITTGIDDDTHRAIGDLPRGRGVLGVLISDPRPLRLADVGSHPRSYGFPSAHPPMRTFLGVPLLVRGQVFGNLYLTEKATGEFDEADEEAVVILAELTGIAIDNARRYHISDERRAELERAVIGFEATTEVVRAVGTETDLDKVLELIAKRGRALVAARLVVILLEDHGELCVSAVAGDDAGLDRDTRLPASAAPYGPVWRSGNALRLRRDDVPSRPPGSSLGIEADNSLLVPLIFRGEAFGVLAAFDRLGGDHDFSSADEHITLSFAASAATAVATAKSVAAERLRRSIEAAEQERRRWARELHDETLQGLAAVNMLLQAALSADGNGLARAAEDAAAHVAEQIESLRNLITDLRPASLDDLGLKPALETLADRVRIAAGLSIDIDVNLAHERGDVPTRLEPDLENTLYRLVQEATTNVVKHARAEALQVRLREAAGVVEVRVADDGIGFDVTEASAGFGLTGMRERVELAGGSLEVVSEPGAGTAVSATIPARHAEP